MRTTIATAPTGRRTLARRFLHPSARGPAACLIGLACVAGCAQTGLGPATNLPPTLTITSGPIDTSATNPVSWSVPITWDARDPDGTIDHVSYAVDPPTHAQALAGADTEWVQTSANAIIARFRAATPDPSGPDKATDFHVFVARAWDNAGGASELVVRAFYATTVAPTVRFTHPAPAAGQVTPVPRSFVIRFVGDDPDGLGTREPAGYRVRLLSDQDPLARAMQFHPDTLRHDAIANDWRGWSTLPAEQPWFPLANLPEGSEWLFAVVAEDAAGAVTPLFTYEGNLMKLFISDASGPRLRMIGPGLDYTYPDGVDSPDSSRWLTMSYPRVAQITFQWSAVPAPGRAITGYRWVLNPDSLESETPRANELLDTGHWSAWSPHTQTAGTLGPWTAGDHLLYVQVEDDLGSRSFGIVRVRAYDATFDRPLLVVDDTRFEFDRLAPGGCLASYTKSWPSATELDTFLFARGGVPWRCATFQPGAVSPPGLFEGYRADTVSTRLAAEDMASTVTLSLLASYRNVIWLTDQEGALQPGSGSSPLAMLRWMSRPPSARVLEDYVRFGGRAWIAGGGAALASLIETDNGANNTASNTVFSGTELHERSAVVTLAHLRTKILATRVSPLLSRSSAARGGWAGHGMDGMLAAPDYARLPASLSLRTPATDPIPPTRSPSQPSFYYLQSVAMEYAQDAIVHEDFGGPGAPRVESVLDTLIEVVGATIDRAPAPAMFYYHGRENGALLFSGFDLWSWSRADAQALVDFVLGEVWGLPRRSPAPAGLPAVAPRAAGRAAGTRSLDPAPRRP